MKSKILRSLLFGFAAPCLAAMGTPQKFKSDKFKRETTAPLKFGSDGKFRILHLTDIHDVDPDMDDDADRKIPLARDIETINTIEKCLDIAKPDLVVFGGDNISGYWQEFTYDYIEKTIKKIVTPIAERNIPLAIVFGNHDGEAGFHREFQMLIYSEYENFRSNFNDADVYGCGNCCLTIKSSDGSRDAFGIWLIDSNDYVKRPDGSFGYDRVHADQIEWYERRAAQLREANGGEPLPSILFQHMPVQQELDMLTETAENGENVIDCGGKLFSFGDKLISGRLRERPCPPDESLDAHDQLESWKRMGDVIAAFFGHDHVNDFHINCDGIDLYQTIGCGYFTYGREHGGRLIILDENDPRRLETETIEIPRMTTAEI